MRQTTTGSGGQGATGTGTGSSAGGNGTGGNGSGNSDGGSIFNTGGGNQGGNGSGGGCVNIELEATSVIAPSDIIIAIDNSGSMSDEIAAVEANIDVNFAQILAASQVDYQVIMVTDHGPNSLNVCIGPPLAGTTDCSGPPVEVPNQFYHYDVNVQSHDSLCKILNTLMGPQGGGEADQNGFHPGGWISLLRQNAVKTFIEITDDGIVCNWNGNSFNDQDQIQPGQDVAVAWDAALLGAAPFQFGTVADRNYLFYSIVGLPEKSPDPLQPYAATEPVVTGVCTASTAYAPGTGYQWLSRGTGGLRFPVCQYQSYDNVFQDIANGVVSGSLLPCDIQLPEDLPDLDYQSLVVNYTPGGGGMPEKWTQVASQAACGVSDNTFYVDTVANTLHLCPNASAKVENDTGEANLDVTAECVQVPD